MKMLKRTLDRLWASRGSKETQYACITHDYGDGWIEVDTSHASYPRRKPGLGDMVAAGLDAIGITKDRVEAIVGGPCGCPQRQAALNAAGAKYLGLSPGSTASTNQP
jgi:hypothetical protein